MDGTMEKIEFTQDIAFGEHKITSIEVAPLTYMEFGSLLSSVAGSPKLESALQRARLVHQTHFKAGKERIKPDVDQVSKLPAAVAKNILSKIDEGQGERGEVLKEGDGITIPIVYKLGTPIQMKNSDGTLLSIVELEFLAETYGELEDVLAEESDVQKTIALLTNIAVPIGVETLTRLPKWALDRITTADGVTLMQKILPNF